MKPTTKTIHFRNGEKLEVTLEIAKLLRDKILSGSPKFQCVSDQNDDLIYMINVEDISFVS